jgi:formylglycine-generating enzyme required for sulfatase activity
MAEMSIIAPMFIFRIKISTKSLISGIFVIWIGLIAGCTPTVNSQPTHTAATTATPPPPSLTASPLPSKTSTAAPTETASPTTTPTITFTPSLTPYPTMIVDAHGAAMVLVPAGEFLMGSESWSGSEKPAHTVYLDSYYIDQYEVSVGAYAEFLNEVGNQIEGVAGKAHWVEEPDPDLHLHRVEGVWQADEGRANHPMNEVTWFGARAFCEWRGARLPSEAEWEKAARGTDGRTYPWGEEEPTCLMANFAGCYYDSVPVDSYPEWVSPYGAYNMAGNVHEWTNDWYDPEYYANSPYENPTGPESGDYKIFRGASWFNGNFQTRTTYRYPKLPVLTYMANGFRCAKSVGN